MTSPSWRAFRRSGCSWSSRPGRRGRHVACARLTNSGGQLAPCRWSAACASCSRRRQLIRCTASPRPFARPILDPALVDEHPDMRSARPSLRRDSWWSTPTAARRRRRGGRTGPCRAAGRAGLLAGSRAHRRALQAGAGRSQAMAAWRSGRATGAPRARMACSVPSAATTR